MGRSSSACLSYDVIERQSLRLCSKHRQRFVGPQKKGATLCAKAISMRQASVW
jgi:hypothetical protein